MLSAEQFKTNLQKIKGKTIAVVYTFEEDNSKGFHHFFIWKSKILSKWMNAIQDLNCLPFIIDVRTFVDKAMNHTLPHIDYVLNMNTGIYDLSVMALVPSVCSALEIPCIPCNAVTIVTGENKRLSNLIASGVGIQIPKELDLGDCNGIYRPVNLGNSMGVIRNANICDGDGIYQEFIQGYDITTPIAYNGMTQQMELLPTVLYLPDSFDPEWFNGENIKQTRKGYKFAIASVDKKTEEAYLKLVQALSIQTFCRIDARVRSSDDIFYKEKIPKLTFENVFFVEINVMPTIREDNNFDYAFHSIDSSSTLYPCIDAEREILGDVDLHRFLLSNSMLSFV